MVARDWVREEHMGYREFREQEDLFCKFIFVKTHKT